MAGYVVLLHEPAGAFADLSPGQMQEIIQKYQRWSRKLRQSGHLLDGRKLKDGEGRNLVRRQGQIVTDGPFSETREVIGGFFLIQADGYDKAQELLSDCPHLDHGRIEIREIDEVG